MRCERCGGFGRVLASLYPGAVRSSPYWAYCPECGGYGVVHCCEGEQAQPDHPSASATMSCTTICTTCRTCQGIGYFWRELPPTYEWPDYERIVCWNCNGQKVVSATTRPNHLGTPKRKE